MVTATDTVFEPRCTRAHLWNLPWGSTKLIRCTAGTSDGPNLLVSPFGCTVSTYELDVYFVASGLDGGGSGSPFGLGSSRLEPPHPAGLCRRQEVLVHAVRCITAAEKGTQGLPEYARRLYAIVLWYSDFVELAVWSVRGQPCGVLAAFEPDRRSCATSCSTGAVLRDFVLGKLGLARKEVEVQALRMNAHCGT